MSSEPATDAAEVNPTAVDALWENVIGQSAAVDALRSAARSPVHAYLIVGPQGSGKMAAAEAFAAELLIRSLPDGSSDPPGSSQGPTPAQTAEMVAGHRHPCVIHVERDGASLSAGQAREVVRSAGMAPTTGSLQIFILNEFHLVSDAAPILLKTIEEPASQTVFIVLANDVPDDLVTIASRCIRVDMSAVPAAAVSAALQAEGVSVDRADLAAGASGGSMSRARLLASDDGIVERRSAWERAVEALDGTGATVCGLVDELLAGIDSLLEPLAAVHEREVSAFEEQSELVGGLPKGDRTRMEARHKREARRVRTDELRSGLASLMAGYRSRASDDDGRRFVEAAGLVQQVTESLTFNPNESLALRSLFTKLDGLAD